MERTKLSKFLIVFAFLIYIAEYIGSVYSLYETTWWYYMTLHFLGGFWVALFFIWFYKPKCLSSLPVLQIMVSLLVVAVLWEVYEYYVFNVIGKLPYDSFDTYTDIIVGLIGGLFALFHFCKNRIVPKKENNV